MLSVLWFGRRAVARTYCPRCQWPVARSGAVHVCTPCCSRLPRLPVRRATVCYVRAALCPALPSRHASRATATASLFSRHGSHHVELGAWLPSALRTRTSVAGSGAFLQQQSRQNTPPHRKNAAAAAAVRYTRAPRPVSMHYAHTPLPSLSNSIYSLTHMPTRSRPAPKATACPAGTGLDTTRSIC